MTSCTVEHSAENLLTSLITSNNARDRTQIVSRIFEEWKVNALPGMFTLVIKNIILRNSLFVIVEKVLFDRLRQAHYLDHREIWSLTTRIYAKSASASFRKAVLGLVVQALGSKETVSAAREIIIESVKDILSADTTLVYEWVCSSVMKLIHEELADLAERAAPNQIEGCKLLENCLIILRRFLEAHLDVPSDDVVGIVNQTASHRSLFVRESTQHLIALLAKTPISASTWSRHVYAGLAKHVGAGLLDEWPHVRFAACVAARGLLLASPAAHRPCLVPCLLPGMCINRQLTAQGIQLYSLESWRLLFGDPQSARRLLEAHIEASVAEILRQSEADNADVREAACRCLGELAARLDPTIMRPYLNVFLKRIHDLMKDPAWAVRDCACFTYGQLILTFPSEADSDSTLSAELQSLLLAHLADNVWSVRESAAIACGNLLEAYPRERHLPRLLEHLNASLPAAKAQAPAEGIPCRFDAADKWRYDNDETLHVGGKVMACCTMSHTTRSEHCTDHGFERVQEPWEVTDGAVYLLREIARVHPDECYLFIPVLLEVVSAYGSQLNLDSVFA